MKMNKSRHRLIKYRHRIFKLYGLLKIQETGIPMRRIISGIYSVRHKSSKAITNLTTLLILINQNIRQPNCKSTGNEDDSQTHSQSRSKIPSRQNLVDKVLNLAKNPLTQPQINFSLPITKVINKTEFTNKGNFTFSNKFYKQIFALSLGLHLKVVGDVFSFN